MCACTWVIYHKNCVNNWVLSASPLCDSTFSHVLTPVSSSVICSSLMLFPVSALCLFHLPDIFPAPFVPTLFLFFFCFSLAIKNQIHVQGSLAAFPSVGSKLSVLFFSFAIFCCVKRGFIKGLLFRLSVFPSKTVFFFFLNINHVRKFEWILHSQWTSFTWREKLCCISGNNA